MSDQQFQSLIGWFGDCLKSAEESLTHWLGGMTLGHWLIVGVALIAWGVLMMRGLGLKKFQ